MAGRFEPFTIEQILKWADQFHDWTGRWPTTRHGTVLGREDISWEAINDAMRKGTRGMPGGMTLHRLLKRHRHVSDPRKVRPDLTRKQIVEWAREYHMRTHKWPKRDSGPVLSAPDISWSTIWHALKRGGPNLPRGETLKQLLRREFGIWSTLGNRPLTIPLILKWADEHRARTGKWPIVLSGKIPGQGRESWCALNEALKHGRRGLPGGSSVAQLLIEHRGASYKPTVAKLTPDEILRWAREYYTSHGRWPTARSGRCKQARMSWALVDRCLRKGQQGLPGGSSIAALMAPLRARERAEPARGPTPKPAPRVTAKPRRKAGVTDARRGRQRTETFDWSASSVSLPWVDSAASPR